MEGTDVSIKLKLTIAEAKELKGCFDQYAAILTGAREMIPMQQIEVQNRLRFAIEDYENGQDYGNCFDKKGSCSTTEIGEDTRVSDDVPPWYGEDA